MIVELTNLTDGPEKSPKQIDLFGHTLNPGESLKVYAALIDKKTRSLEEQGDISIGSLPSWYTNFKSKKSRVMSIEDLTKHLSPKQPVPKPVLPVVSEPSAPPAKKSVSKKNA